MTAIDYTLPDTDRRKEGRESTLLVLIKQIHDNQMELARGQQVLDGKLTKHMTDETQELAEAIANLLKEAFPAGDPDGHRRHHEAVISKAEASAKFWQTMITELSKYGLIGFIGWAGYTLWTAFLHGPTK